jgi:3D (Asp-Asp-Asp) domain-containing protein
VTGLPRVIFPIALTALLAVACALRTEIRQILADPRAYEGKTVTVDGEVTNTFSLVFIKYFELNDGTGTLGVVSDKPLPAKGQRLKVTGEVREAFSLGDRNVTVLIEKSPAKS